MKLSNQRMFARLKTLRHEDSDLDLMISDLLVGSAVHMEAVEAGSRRSVVERRHCVVVRTEGERRKLFISERRVVRAEQTWKVGPDHFGGTVTWQ
jgi:hypothetical protein